MSEFKKTIAQRNERERARHHSTLVNQDTNNLKIVHNTGLIQKLKKDKKKGENNNVSISSQSEESSYQNKFDRDPLTDTQLNYQQQKVRQIIQENRKKKLSGHLFKRVVFSPSREQLEKTKTITPLSIGHGMQPTFAKNKDISRTYKTSLNTSLEITDGTRPVAVVENSVPTENGDKQITPVKSYKEFPLTKPTLTIQTRETEIK